MMSIACMCVVGVKGYKRFTGIHQNTPNDTQELPINPYRTQQHPEVPHQVYPWYLVVILVWIHINIEMTWVRSPPVLIILQI